MLLDIGPKVSAVTGILGGWKGRSGEKIWVYSRPKFTGL